MKVLLKRFHLNGHITEFNPKSGASQMPPHTCILTKLLKCPASLTAIFLNIHSVAGFGMYCKACCKITAALWALAETGGGVHVGSDG